ncbi:hypothetical protein HUO09_05695 [Vibrio sp. Y2-5]|uniref:hypothetical protein n=1 Tax=Vibrio sp. Y2-5 TaxID=2743977 RepID=UPI001661563D|nr:hypothetical protein [Vibrio sp. Y2-5]MBD0785825.1 hypothetical protein [Vibrio sp. Y2-5]
MSNRQREDLIRRMKNVVQNTCNTIGCDKCGLKWDDGCSATDLQDKSMTIEIEKMNSKG